MLNEKENKEEITDLIKGLKELGFSDQEIEKALNIDTSTNEQEDEKTKLISEIEDLEKALSKKKDMLKTLDGEDSESMEDEKEKEGDEEEEEEKEDVVEKSIKSHLDSFSEKFEKMIEASASEKQQELEQLIKSLEDKIAEQSNRISQITKSFVDRRPFSNMSFIEKGETNEDSDSIISLSGNKEMILKGLEDMMEKSTGSDKEHIGQQIIKFNASNVCDPRTLLKLSSEKKWKLVE